MHRFGFLFSVRFWVPVWLGLLFVGLLPLPPAAELVITIGVLSHSGWYVRGRLRRAAQRRALARAEKAEEEEHRRLRRRRALQGDTSVPPVRGELRWH
jgi:hypothetical protein